MSITHWHGTAAPALVELSDERWVKIMPHCTTGATSSHPVPGPANLRGAVAEHRVRRRDARPEQRPLLVHIRRELERGVIRPEPREQSPSQ